MKITNENDLQELLINDDFLNALFFASPDLYVKSKKLQQHFDDAEFQNIKFSLLKYFIRFCCRPTPFGLFSGLGIGCFKNQDNILLGEYYAHKPHIRVDSESLVYLEKYISNLFEVKSELLFYTNTSLYFLGDDIRLIEKVRRNESFDFVFTSVKFDDVLLKVIDLCKNGMTIENLCSSFNDEFELNEIEEYINELIKSEILVSELELQITNESYFDKLTSALTVTNSIEALHIRHEFIRLNDIFREFKKNHFNQSNFEKLVNFKKQFSLHKIAPDDFKIQFQVDTFLGHENFSLNDSRKKNILKALDLFSLFGVKHYSKNIMHFKEKFIERYQDKLIPLSEALDNESGIGYLEISNVNVYSSILHGINFSEQNSESRNIEWGNRDSFFLHKYLNCLKDGENEIVIEPEDLHLFKSINYSLFPETFSVLCSVGTLHDGKEAIQIKSVGGTSAVNLFSRFTHISEELCTLSKELQDYEKDKLKDYILAEVVHLPEPKIGNVTSRVHYRDYEIGYLGNVNQKGSQKISLDDLYLCVRQNKLLLYSKLNNKIVIPKISNAHNYTNSKVPIYRFLGDFQMNEKISGVSFDLGCVSSYYQYSPRVRMGDIILAKAMWKLFPEDINPIIDAKSKNDAFREFLVLQKKHNIPAQFFVIQGDMELYINTELTLYFELLCNIFRKSSIVKLTEVLFEFKNSMVVDENNNNFLSEFNFFVLNHNKSDWPKQINESNNIEKTTFFPGSDWLFLKLYCGSKNANRILSEFNRYVKTNITENLTWFFVRYADPEPHLRIRVYISQNDNQLIFKLHEFFKTNEIYFSKISIDTYKREFSRYGGRNIEQFEKVFYADTCAYLKYIEGADSNNSVHLIKYAISSLNSYLDNFNFSLNEKIEFCKTNADSFYNEFNVHGKIKKQINKKYVELKKLLFSLNEDNYYAEIEQLLSARSIIIEKILIHPEMNVYSLKRSDTISLIGSIIHMSINRIFYAKPRHHELLVYDFALKLYLAKKHTTPI